LITSFAFYVFGGALATLIRSELASQKRIWSVPNFTDAGAGGAESANPDGG
jgi:hypothetical protein